MYKGCWGKVTEELEPHRSAAIGVTVVVLIVQVSNSPSTYNITSRPAMLHNPYINLRIIVALGYNGLLNTKGMLNYCLQWNKWVLTNLSHE